MWLADTDLRTFQQTVVVGYLGSDPRVFTYDDGNFTVHMRMATRRRKRGTETDEEITTWHRVRLYGAAARYAKEWVRKGDRVMVVGTLSYWYGPGDVKTRRMGCEIRSAFCMAMDDHRHSEAAKELAALQMFDLHPPDWSEVGGAVLDDTDE